MKYVAKTYQATLGAIIIVGLGIALAVRKTHDTKQQAKFVNITYHPEINRLVIAEKIKITHSSRDQEINIIRGFQISKCWSEVFRLRRALSLFCLPKKVTKKGPRKKITPLFSEGALI